MVPLETVIDAFIKSLNGVYIKRGILPEKSKDSSDNTNENKYKSTDNKDETE